MKFENAKWRFESPGPLPDATVYRLFEMAQVTAAQGRVQDILEDFKGRFPGADGYWKSSNEKYARDDLYRDMRLHSTNAPLFIEAYLQACSDIREQGLDAPSVNDINTVLFQTRAGYQIDGDVIVAQNWVPEQDAFVGQPEVESRIRSKEPETMFQGSSSKKTVVSPIVDVAFYGATDAKAEKAKDFVLRAFLCHSSVDKPAVKALYDRLKQDGFDPWLDAVKLKPGQDWEFEIKKAVKNSHVVIVCLSKISVTKAGFAQKEIKLALDVADQQPEGRIFIIPARLEECEVPDRLGKWHWVNLYDDDGYNKLTDSLIECGLTL
jgi:hypothetical protein